MKTIKIVTKQVAEIDTVICNKCGESCCLPKSLNKTGDLYGLIETEVRGGYYSEALTDMSSYTFSMCESCLKELFVTFKIPVEQKDIDFGS